MHSPLRLRPAAVMVKLALACLAAGHAHAAEPVVEPADVLSLDDVVVTASGFEQNL
ncbi:putative TonB-dependent siderophore receptor, partial [Pseudomonas syringae pv. spinaceae]